MNAEIERADRLIADAIRKLQCFMQSGIAGFYVQAWDRLRDASYTRKDLWSVVEACRQPSADNARKLSNRILKLADRWAAEAAVNGLVESLASPGQLVEVGRDDFSPMAKLFDPWL